MIFNPVYRILIGGRFINLYVFTCSRKILESPLLSPFVNQFPPKKRIQRRIKNVQGTDISTNGF